MSKSNRLLDTAPILIMLVIVALAVTSLNVTQVSAAGYPMTINSVETISLSTGTVAINFTRGDTIFFKVNVSGVGTYAYVGPGYAYVARSFMMIVRVTDPQGHMVFFGVVKDSISQYETKSYSVGWWIPSGAMPGQYKVKVMIMDNWPWIVPSTALAMYYEATFTVSS